MLLHRSNTELIVFLINQNSLRQNIDENKNLKTNLRTLKSQTMINVTWHTVASIIGIL